MEGKNLEKSTSPTMVRWTRRIHKFGRFADGVSAFTSGMLVAATFVAGSRTDFLKACLGTATNFYCFQTDWPEDQEIRTQTYHVKIVKI
nr:MAG TPA: hypothetical protein [Caudoviricetes sp.]